MTKRRLFVFSVFTIVLIIVGVVLVMLRTDHQTSVKPTDKIQTNPTVALQPPQHPVQQLPLHPVQQPLQQYQPSQVPMCPACHGAGYFLKLPRDLCPKCRGHGFYQVVYIKKSEFRYLEYPLGLGLSPRVVNGFIEEEVGREQKVCDVCGGLGVYFNPEERCGTCGGIVTEEWKRKWADLARQYAFSYPIYEERVLK